MQRYLAVIAQADADSAAAAFDPELYAGAEVGEQRRNEVSNATGDRFEVTGDDRLVEAGIRQPLVTGTELELEAGLGRSTSSRRPDQEEARIALTVTQALLQGRRPSANRAAIQQAALEVAATHHELRGYVTALVASVETAYWNLVLAERSLAIQESSLRLAEQQRDDIAARIEVGTAPGSAAAATRSEVARRQQALINARSLLAERRLRLLRLLGGGIVLDAAVVPDSAPALARQAPVHLDDHLALARRERPELAEARVRLEQDRLEVIATSDGMLPRLDFFVGLAKTGFGSDAGDAIAELDGKTYRIEAGLDFAYDLGRRSARGRNQAANASRDQAAAAVVNLEEQVELEVRLAWNEVERAQAQVTAAAASAALAAETLRVEQERLAVGVGLSLLVVAAGRDLLAAQLAEAEAAVASRIALVRLHLAEGSLLARRGLNVPE